MNRKRTTIYNALPIVAAAYGQKFGVKVTIGGDDAYTNGEMINIPNIPEDYPHMDAIWGYLAHEAAHIRFTEFSVDWGCDLEKQLTNILEDCRIERAMAKVFPGVVYTLKATIAYLVERDLFGRVNEESHPAATISMFCLYYLRSQVLGQDMLIPYLDEARGVLGVTFPKGVVVRLNALLRKVPALQSTAEAAELARDILKMLEEEQEKAGPPPLGQQQQQSDNGNSARSQEQQSGGRGDETQGDPQNNAGKPTGNQGGESDTSDGQQQHGVGGQSADVGKPGSHGSGEMGHTQKGQDRGTSDADRQAQAIAKALAAGAGDLPDNAMDSFRREMQSVAENGGGNPHYETISNADDAPRHPSGRSMAADVKSTTAKIRTQLLGLVQASQQRGVRNTRSGKRLDAPRLHRVLQGDTRVFRKSTDKQRPNTAVHILVDLSASMGGLASGNGKTMAKIAQESALALAMALEPINGVNPAVTAFHGSHQGCSSIKSVMRHGNSVKQRLDRFMLAPNGGTPMAEGIWYAAFELSQTREDRKMIIVITDGEPNEVAACHAVIDLCENSDIEMIGIGIGTNSVARMFQNHIIIQDVTDLQRTLFKLMERSLTVAAA